MFKASYPNPRGFADSASGILTCLLISLLVLVSSDAQGAERGPLVGIWQIEDIDNPKVVSMTIAMHHGFDAILDQSEGATVPYYGIFQHRRPDKITTHRAQGRLKKSDDGSYRTKFGQFEYCDCVSVRYTVNPTGDPDVMIGEWVYGKKRGVSTWRRQPPIKIDSVSHEIELVRMGPLDRVEYGTRPTKIELNHPAKSYDVVVWIRGQRFAGGHEIRIDPSSRIKINYNSSRYRCARGGSYRVDQSWYNCRKKNSKPNPLSESVTGINVRLVTKKGITPGTKTLWIDGQPVPLDIVIHGYPEPLLPELASIEIVDPESLDPIEEIEFGRSFKVRLTYAEPPVAEITEIVTISTSWGEPLKVEVTGSGGVIVSDEIPVVPLGVEP